MGLGQEEPRQYGAAGHRPADGQDEVGPQDGRLAGSRRRAGDGGGACLPGQRRRAFPCVRQEKRQGAEGHRHRHLDPRRANDLQGRRRAICRGDGGVGRRRLPLCPALFGGLQARQSGPHSGVQDRRRRCADPRGTAGSRTRPGRAAQAPGVSARPSRRGRRSSSAIVRSATRTSCARSRPTCGA